MRTRRTYGTGPGLTEALRILVVNAGSSTLKLRLLARDDQLLVEDAMPADHAGFDEDAVAAVVARLGEIDAVGHRFVHGGPRLTGPVRLDAEVEDYLHSLVDLAPLHQPPALAGVALMRRLLPDAPAVACLDTAFHTAFTAHPQFHLRQRAGLFFLVSVCRPAFGA